MNPERQPLAAQGVLAPKGRVPLGAWALPSVLPTLCCGWVFAAAAGGDLTQARRAGAATAGLMLLAVALVAPVVARGAWRDLQACGLLAQALLAGERPSRTLLRVAGIAADRTLRAFAPWLVLPCALVGLGGWTGEEALALVASLLLLVGLAIVAGLGVAWSDRPGHERPALGIPLLLALTAPGIAVALRVADLLAPADLASWLARALARATPLAALRPVWADGPPRAWVPLSFVIWGATLVMAALALCACTAWAIRATRDPDREAA